MYIYYIRDPKYLNSPFSMFNKPAKFEKQLSRGAMTVSNGVSKTGSPTGVISKSMVEEVHSVNDEERQKVDIQE
jgi:hypothetical protein